MVPLFLTFQGIIRLFLFSPVAAPFYIPPLMVISTSSLTLTIQNFIEYGHPRGEGNGTPSRYSCLANPMDRGAWQVAVHGVAEGRTRLSDFLSLSLSCIREGNGNPLRCSCLQNPRDGGAWWVAIYGVAQSRTRLKRLSSSSSSGCEVCCIRVCFAFPSCLMMLNIFSCAYWPFVHLFQRNVYSHPLLIF